MQAVILAAGQSSRFWPFNKNHKSLFFFKEKPFTNHKIKIQKEKQDDERKNRWLVYE